MLTSCSPLSDLIGAPDLVHFIYKSRTHIQITQPRPPSDPEQAHRAMQLYQHAFDAIHGKSGQPPVRQIYIRTKDDACFGWVSDLWFSPYHRGANTIPLTFDAVPPDLSIL